MRFQIGDIERELVCNLSGMVMHLGWKLGLGAEEAMSMMELDEERQKLLRSFVNECVAFERSRLLIEIQKLTSEGQ